ncbi:MAG: hypothetical protein M3321_03785 [Actinomycetota bacterium]|nr:hypothetical protein [Actinomycetota bacterium]
MLTRYFALALACVVSASGGCSAWGTSDEEQAERLPINELTARVRARRPPAELRGRQLTCQYADDEWPFDAVCEISKSGRRVRLFTLKLEDGRITDVTGVPF